MNKDRIKLITAMLLFGTIGLVRRYIPYSSALTACARALIGAVLLGAVILLRRKRVDWGAVKKQALRLSVSGVLLGINWILLFEAYRHTTVAVATVCYYMAPVCVIAVSPWILRERVPLRKWLCVLAALAGVALTAGVQPEGTLGAAGVLYGLAAAVLYAAVVLLNKKITGLAALERTMMQLAAAALTLLPYVCLTQDVTALTWEVKGVLWLLVAGAVHTALAYALYFGSMERLSAQSVALISYIDPVTAVLLSALLLREPLPWPAAVGAVLVLCAALLGELPAREK
ncbi:MAG: DMT family transporter [Clostridia bacterium]|nr:DMT family transporter [Clostridia bacterium]